jgi:hypothetical protein
MKSLNMKLALSAVAIAMLASPALAQGKHRQVRADYSNTETMQQPAPEHYPNGAPKTGTEESIESGAEFNLSR